MKRLVLACVLAEAIIIAANWPAAEAFSLGVARWFHAKAVPVLDRIVPPPARLYPVIDYDPDRYTPAY